MQDIKKSHNHGHKVLSGFLCLLAICLLNVVFEPVAWAQGKNIFTPQIPKANRLQKNKVFLEHADKLRMDEKVSKDYQVLVGNVKFRKEGMFMYCDSAYFYEKTNSLDAFGNVKMEQGDTLFVYGDLMYYDGMAELARLRHNVKMENRDVTLFTDSLDYDMIANLGYYFEGGKIVDSENELTSVYGQYEPDTKNAEFLFDVELINPEYIMKTDTLHYNTNTNVADIVGYTTIVSDSNIIYTDKGWYDTKNEKSTLYNRSLIVGHDGQRLTGDTIFYNRNLEFGEVFGNMVLTDSINKSILEGNYGYHDDVNKKSFATKRARALEFSQKDTLYLHGDTIRTFLNDDSTRVMTAYHKVRFYRIDMQGLADSMSFESRDSMLNMYRHPIVWNGQRQITGNIINVHLNDSTVDWAKLPDFGFMCEFIEGPHYNQLSGKEMIAYFKDGDITQLDVNGNVQSIFYPQENDSTYNKLVNSESSFLIVNFKNQEVERLKMWPEVTGKAIPLYLAKKADYYLQAFKWHESLRPKDKEDIFNVSEEMIQLMGTPQQASRHRKSVTRPPLPKNEVKKDSVVQENPQIDLNKTDENKVEEIK